MRNSKNGDRIGIAVIVFFMITGVISVRKFNPPQPVQRVHLTSVEPASSYDTWGTYNFTEPSKIAIFSFRYPPQGPYCQECFEAWPEDSHEVTGIRISGGTTSQFTQPQWILNVGIMYENKPQSAPKGAAPLTTLIKNFRSLAVGNSIKVKDEYGIDMFIQRQPDEDIDGIVAQIFSAAVEEPTKGRTYALIPRPDYTVIMSYSYNQHSLNYFNSILQSFLLTLADSPTKGETRDMFQKQTVEKDSIN